MDEKSGAELWLYDVERTDCVMEMKMKHLEIVLIYFSFSFLVSEDQ